MLLMSFISLISLELVQGLSPQCVVTDLKSLLDEEGCESIGGLNVTSLGGTVLNDHNCGALLPKQVFSEEPFIKFRGVEDKKYYTILIVDPDAPPQNEGEFYLHMLKSNVPASALKNVDGSKTSGVDYRGYKPPTPPRGSGVHRYLSLLYEQFEGNNFLPNVPSTRSRFALADWLKGKSLCGPVAAMQFRSQF